MGWGSDSEAASEMTQPKEKDDPGTRFFKLWAKKLEQDAYDRQPEQVAARQAERESWASKHPKRGRPRVFDDTDLPHQPLDQHTKSLPVGVTSAETRRGLQENRYAYCAGRVLIEHIGEYPEIAEITGLFPVGDSVSPNLYRVKEPGCRPARIGVLAELGRLICTYSDGEEVAVRWAVELAKMRPKLTTKKAVAWIRQRRLRKTNLGSAEGVAGAITRAIDGYLAGHPDTPLNAIQDALSGVAWIFNEGK